MSDEETKTTENTTSYPKIEVTRADLADLGVKLADAMIEQADEAEKKARFEAPPERRTEGHGEVVMLEIRLSDGRYELTTMGNLKPGLRPITVRDKTRDLALAKARLAYAHGLMRARYTTDWETARLIARNTTFTAWSKG